MNNRILLASAVAVSLVAPLAARAQGIPDGVAHGASVGNRTAGPIGAVVGGAVGGVIGGFEGVLGVHAVSYQAQRRLSPGISYCEAHFRSYNARTETYVGYDGRRHSCP